MCTYSEYDLFAYRDELAVKSGKKKTYNTNKVLVTAAAWRENHRGSAECFTTSMTYVYAAYHESKDCEEW